MVELQMMILKLKTLNCLEGTGQVIIMVEFVFIFVITCFFKKKTRS